MVEIVRNNLRLASLNPDDAISGGLALNNVTVEILSSRFVMWDYQGKMPSESPALKWVVRDVETGIENEQWWSAGSAESGLIPAEEGRGLQITGNQKGMVKDCKAMMLLASLRKSGFPAEDLASDVSVFDGMVVHIIQEADKERKGLKDLKENRTVPVVDKIVSRPGEGGKGKGKGSKSKASTTTAAEPDEDMMALTISTIMNVLSEKGSMPRIDLGNAVFQALGDNPLKPKIVTWIYTPNNLEKLGMLKIDSGIVSMGG